MERSTGADGRRRRPLTRQQLSARLLNTAVDLVRTQGGLKVSLDELPYEDIIRRAGVARSAAYRVWPYKADFSVDLLCHLTGPAHDLLSLTDRGTIERIAAVVAERADELRTVEGRWRLAAAAARIGITHNFESAKGQFEWTAFVALSAALLSDDAAQERVRRTAVNTVEPYTRMLEDYFTDLLDVFGFRLRPGMLLTAAAALTDALMEGMLLRHVTTPDWTDRRINFDSGDGTALWSLPALGFWSLCRTYVEPDPDYDPDRALATYAQRLSDGAAAEWSAASQRTRPARPAVAGHRGARARGLTDDEVRSAMLHAATELARESAGLRVGLHDLRFDLVIALADVPRNAAYRLWSTRQAFHRAVLVEMLRRERDSGRQYPDVGAGDRVLERTVRATPQALTTSAGRRTVLLQVLWAILGRPYEEMIASHHWRNLLALTAVLATEPGLRAELLGEAPSRSEPAHTAADWVEHALAVTGHRCRRGVTASTVTALLLTGSEGLMLRRLSTPTEVERCFQPSVPDIQAPWPLPALGGYAVLETLIEPVPDYDLDTALAARGEWTRRRAADHVLDDGIGPSRSVTAS